MGAPLFNMSARKPIASTDSDDRQVLARIDRELVVQMIAETPEGSQVSLGTATHQRYTGTLIKGQLKDPVDRVGLLNCISRETVPGPGDRQQCKTSHVPLQVFETSELTEFSVISPPPENFKAPNITKDSSGVTVAEIVFRDGHRWGKSAAAETVDQSTAAESADRSALPSASVKVTSGTGSKGGNTQISP